MATPANRNITLIKARIQRQQEEIDRKKLDMQQAIESYALAQTHLALLCAQLERAEEKAEV